MAKRSGGGGTGRGRREEEPLVNRCVDSVFRFIRYAEFEILFVLFFLISFILFKDLTLRPEYNQILVKKPGRTRLVVVLEDAIGLALCEEREEV